MSEAPEWLVELLTDAVLQAETNGICNPGIVCGVCDCGARFMTPQQLQHERDLHRQRASGIADIVWQALTERVGLEIKEGQMRSIQNAADNSIGFAMDTEYRLKTLPEVDEMCPNCVTPWKCNGPHTIEEQA